MYDLNVLFYLKKTKKNKAGESPIYLRITLNGQRAEVSIRRRINPVSWDARSQRPKGKSEKMRLLNNYMDELENKLNRYYNLAIQENQNITANYLKNILSGNDKNTKMLILVFEEYLKLLEREKGRKYTPKTVARYEHGLNHLKKYLKMEYGQEDIEFGKLNIQFIRKFDVYLQIENDYHPNTVIKYLKILKSVINAAISFGYMDRNPFQGYSTTYRASHRKYLSKYELNAIETKMLTNERLERVRDVFIFICYTGISYFDLINLTTNNIAKGIDGKNWLNYERQKTKIWTKMPLLPPAQRIIDKYKENPECIADNKLFPVISNQKFNEYLKEIAIICEIDKPVTAHIGRHTFATTITLSNGVPIETVQKMLAHSNLATTQIYSKVVDTKISEDMERLSKRII